MWQQSACSSLVLIEQLVSSFVIWLEMSLMIKNICAIIVTCQFGKFSWMLDEFQLLHRCHAEIKRKQRSVLGNTTQIAQNWDEWRKHNILFPLKFKINTLFKTKHVHTNEDLCELVQWTAISLVLLNKLGCHTPQLHITRKYMCIERAGISRHVPWHIPCKRVWCQPQA